MNQEESKIERNPRLTVLPLLSDSTITNAVGLSNSQKNTLKKIRDTYAANKTIPNATSYVKYAYNLEVKSVFPEDLRVAATALGIM